MEHSIYQLQKLINRRNIVKDPSKSVAPCKDIFMLVVEAHILAAAMQTLGMASLEDTPSEEFFSKESTQKGSVQRRTILINALSKLANQCVDLNLVFKEDLSADTRQLVDAVKEYAKEVLSLGLLFMEFNYSIREGVASFAFGDIFCPSSRHQTRQTTLSKLSHC